MKNIIKIDKELSELISTINQLIPDFEVSSDTIACLKEIKDFQKLFAGYYIDNKKNKNNYNFQVESKNENNKIVNKIENYNYNNNQFGINSNNFDQGTSSNLYDLQKDKEKIDSFNSKPLLNKNGLENNNYNQSQINPTKSSIVSILGKKSVHDNNKESENSNYNIQNKFESNYKNKSSIFSEEKLTRKSTFEFNNFLEKSIINDLFEVDQNINSPLFNNQLKYEVLKKIKSPKKNDLNKSLISIFNENKNIMNNSYTIDNPKEFNVINKLNNSVQNLILSENEFDRIDNVKHKKNEENYSKNFKNSIENIIKNSFPDQANILSNSFSSLDKIKDNNTKLNLNEVFKNIFENEMDQEKFILNENSTSRLIMDNQNDNFINNIKKPIRSNKTIQIENHSSTNNLNTNKSLTYNDNNDANIQITKNKNLSDMEEVNDKTLLNFKENNIFNNPVTEYYYDQENENLNFKNEIKNSNNNKKNNSIDEINSSKRFSKCDSNENLKKVSNNYKNGSTKPNEHLDKNPTGTLKTLKNKIKLKVQIPKDENFKKDIDNKMNLENEEENKENMIVCETGNDFNNKETSPKYKKIDIELNNEKNIGRTEKSLELLMKKDLPKLTNKKLESIQKDQDENFNLELFEENEFTQEKKNPNENPLDKKPVELKRDNREKLLERLLNRKTIRSNNENDKNCLPSGTISTFLLDKTDKSTTEYIDFIANLNKIDLNNQMEKRIQDLIEKTKEPSKSNNQPIQEILKNDSALNVNNKRYETQQYTTDLIQNNNKNIIYQKQNNKKEIKKKKNNSDNNLFSNNTKILTSEKSYKNKIKGKKLFNIDCEIDIGDSKIKNRDEKLNNFNKIENSIKGEFIIENRDSKNNNVGQKINKENSQDHQKTGKSLIINDIKLIKDSINPLENNIEENIQKLDTYTKNVDNNQTFNNNQLTNTNNNTNKTFFTNNNTNDHDTINKNLGLANESNKNDIINYPKKNPDESQINFENDLNNKILITANHNVNQILKNDENIKIPSIFPSNTNTQINTTQNYLTNSNTLKFLNPFPLNMMPLTPTDLNLNVPSPYLNLGLLPINIASINNSPWQSEMLLALNGINNISNYGLNNNNIIGNSNEKINNNFQSGGFYPSFGNSDDYFNNSKLLSPNLNNKNYHNYNSEADKDFELNIAKNYSGNFKEIKNLDSNNNSKHILLKTNIETYEDFDNKIKNQNELIKKINLNENKHFIESNQKLINEKSKEIEKEGNLFSQKLNQLKIDERLLYKNNQNLFMLNQSQYKNTSSTPLKNLENSLINLPNLNHPKSANNFISSNLFNLPLYHGLNTSSPYQINDIYNLWNNNKILIDKKISGNLDPSSIVKSNIYSNLTNCYRANNLKSNYENELDK